MPELHNNENVFTVDLTNVKTSFTLLPIGGYYFEISSVESKNGPKGAYLNLRLTPLADADSNPLPDEENYGSLFDIISFSSEARFKLVQLMLALGVSEDDLNVPNFTFSLADLIGNQVFALVKHVNDSYRNAIVAKIASYELPPGGFANEEVPETADAPSPEAPF